ncbi:MAG: glyoxalase/bleomycin resistance/extradiol dioxygenase family protein [Planctomycetaceae bacterium]|jgi:lactoylglutathione lyase|nr:glyoxalase/bleomycin resistance/extradiol dioxygenase family protein [Planctomycetaceae bacterium]MBT6486886.1 glyoxalase/bleomycin resistance/extradiol dioxygenase family protein [Planctomycetaceae bacterium]MBT6494785.1 glyoxalase/bleomycin resistance/extradiol dioxygenase family protein [Planctomycetaceae bacterium]
MTDVSLSLLVLKTHQIDAMCQFYESVGIDLVAEQHGSGPLHFAGRIGSAVIEIYPLVEGDEADKTIRLGFVVGDLGPVIESLVRRDLSPQKEPKKTEWGLRIVVKDPDGRSVELYQRGE